MKTIEGIYDEYKIMPNLRAHMYRVTAVANIISSHFQGLLDVKSITQACLLHDMGNIIKFDLSVFPEFTKDQGQEYWENMKTEFMERYKTTDEHDATIQIAQEVGASLRTLEILYSIGNLSHTQSINMSDEFERKICLYADMRVSPNGVVSLESRLEEVNKRYELHPHAVTGIAQKEIADALAQIERDIFSRTDLVPELITEESIQEVIESLKKTTI